MANASGPSEMECEAANAVAQLLRGTFNYRDVPGAPNGTHDFDIDVDNDGTIALEVTSLVVEKFKAMEAALGERYWFDERLRFNWCPTIVIANRKSKGTDIRTLRASVGAIFKSLEDRYVSGPNALMYTDLIASGEFLKSHPVDPDLLSLYELGVRNLNVLIPYDGRAMISVGYVGIPENQEINDLVTEEIDNNYEKLLRAVATERHLFVWVDRSDWESESKMFLHELPKAILPMHKQLDAVWLGLWSPKFQSWSNVGALWKAGKDGNWSNVSAELWRMGDAR